MTVLTLVGSIGVFQCLERVTYVGPGAEMVVGIGPERAYKFSIRSLVSALREVEGAAEGF